MHLLGGAPEGWAWTKTIQEELVYESDPYATFNLGDWLNENTNTVITTEANYIDTIDLFANYNEEQTLWSLIWRLLTFNFWEIIEKFLY